MSNNGSPIPAKVDPHVEGRKLFQRGLIVYYILAVFGVLYGLFIFRGSFDIAGGIGLAACFIIAPSQLCKGSEGWRTFTQLFGLALVFASFGGSFTVLDNSARTIGFLSLAIFGLSIYLVKVFGYNQKVVVYMAYLRSSGEKHKLINSGVSQR